MAPQPPTATATATATATPNQDVKRFKIVIIGDGNTGKSTFVERFTTGKFHTNYVPTLGVDVHPLCFNTNHGPLILDVWDTAGHEKFKGLAEAYYIQADGVIGMFDCHNYDSYEHMQNWHDVVATAVPDIVKVACGNKVDIATEESVSTNEKLHLREVWGQYYDISAKSQYNTINPLLYLARELTGHDDLTFVGLLGSAL